MQVDTRKKWDRFAPFYKIHTKGAERRWRDSKKKLFQKMGPGKILFLAVGVGSEIKFFPDGKEIVGIDISPAMLRRAEKAARKYNGSLELLEMDARQMRFEENTFDQVFTSCTFCSVPNPVQGLREVFRVLKPGGDLWMFEHTGSRFFPFRQLLSFMNPVAKKIGPSLTRNTVGNVQRAGFIVQRVTNIYLDVVKVICAVKKDGLAKT